MGEGVGGGGGAPYLDTLSHISTVTGMGLSRLVSLKQVKNSRELHV